MGFLLNRIFLVFKIDDVVKTKELSQNKATRKNVAGESFADYLKSNSAAEAKQVQATAAMTSADAIFAAQMVDDEEEKQIKRKLIKKGRNLLDCLDEIREGLLFGEFSKDRLIEISRIVKQKDVNTTDEKLKEIIAEIELRVEVELAKLMR